MLMRLVWEVEEVVVVDSFSSFVSCGVSPVHL